MLRIISRNGEGEREPETARPGLRSNGSAPAPRWRRLSAREEYKLLTEFEGAVLTSEEGIIDLNDATRTVVALLDNQTLVVSEGQVLHPSVAYVMEQACAHGVEIDSHVITKKSTLVQLYALTVRRTREDTLAGDLSEAEHYLTEMLNDAAQKRVTDVHIAVEQLETIVSYRQDGMIERHDTRSRTFGESLLRRAYLACDESEGGALRLKEHHGARMTGAKFPLPFGVQAIRLQFNAKASDCYYLVLRLLHEEGLEGEGDIDELGYSNFQVEAIRQARTKPFGLAVIAGVTGSGKSTTLQRNLQSLLRERAGTINVITIEDPPEYRIKAAHQLPVVGDSDERARGFAAAITASLRSDPDVIMIGEVRERESALLAVKATMTGHAVWTTVHASSASGALERLIAEGVPEHRLLDPNVASILIAQRLVPCVCPSCSMHWQDERVDREHLGMVPGFLSRFQQLLTGRYARALEWVRVRNERGCDAEACRRGYVGRTLIAEVVPVDSGYLDVFRDRGAGAAEAFWADEREGMRMREHGMMKVLAGQIDPLDLYYVAGIPDPVRADAVFAHAHREGLIPEVL